MKAVCFFMLSCLSVSLLFGCQPKTAVSSLMPGDRHIGDREEKTISFEGVSLSYQTWVAEDVTGMRFPAFVDPSGFMYDDVPGHVRFNFSNSYILRKPFAGLQFVWLPWLKSQNSEGLGIGPQIYIFPTVEYAQISPLAADRIETLRMLLENNILPTEAELPVLPTFNSAQDLHGKLSSIDFKGGRGLRFIARYSQEAVPVVNPHVFYTFQGLTKDNRLFVAAFFPLYIPALPDQIRVENWDSFNQGYRDYLVDISSRLETLASENFEPSLDSLDSLIRTLSIPEAYVSH